MLYGKQEKLKDHKNAWNPRGNEHDFCGAGPPNLSLRCLSQCNFFMQAHLCFHLLSSHVSPTVSTPYTTLTVHNWLKNYKRLFPILHPYIHVPFALAPLPPPLLCHSLEFKTKPEAETYSHTSLSFITEAVSFCLVPSITGLDQSVVHISL